MYPPVLGYGDHHIESFEDYYARWPTELAAIPKAIIQDWVYRHWRDFKSHWISSAPHLWNYRLEPFSNAEILSIDHVGNWIEDLDEEGVEYVTNMPRSKARFAQHMLTNGTFPVPILVAEHAGHVIHPRSHGEYMKEPYQLIEGHCRLACIRGMIHSNHLNLLATHNVWVATIPYDSPSRT